MKDSNKKTNPKKDINKEKAIAELLKEYKAIDSRGEKLDGKEGRSIRKRLRRLGHYLSKQNKVQVSKKANEPKAKKEPKQVSEAIVA